MPRRVIGFYTDKKRRVRPITKSKFKVKFPKVFKKRERVQTAYSGYGDPYKDVDTGIKEVVKWFNDNGFNSFASCEGHLEDPRPILSSYISFDIYSPEEWNRFKKVADKYFVPYKRKHFTFYPSDKPVWEERHIDSKYLTYVKKLPESYIIMEFEWNTRTDSPRNVRVEVIPKNNKSFVPEWNNEKRVFDVKEIPYIMNFPDLKVSGRYPTQSEWDNVRNSSYEWLVNKLGENKK